GIGVWSVTGVQRCALPILAAGRVRPLREERPAKKPITLDALNSGRLPNFFGDPVSGLTWLDDGEHFLQYKGRTLYKVHALTGRAKPFFDADQFPPGPRTPPGMGAPNPH